MKYKYFIFHAEVCDFWQGGSNDYIHGGESGGLNDRVTEFRAGFRTKQVKILTISFLIPSRFSYSKVHIPSHYSRQILILELFYYVQKFFTQD